MFFRDVVACTYKYEARVREREGEAGGSGREEEGGREVMMCISVYGYTNVEHTFEFLHR